MRGDKLYTYEETEAIGRKMFGRGLARGLMLLTEGKEFNIEENLRLAFRFLRYINADTEGAALVLEGWNSIWDEDINKAESDLVELLKDFRGPSQ